jgi:hypothetical protein
LKRIIFGHDSCKDEEINKALNENKDPEASKRRLIVPIGWNVEKHPFYCNLFKELVFTFVASLKFKSFKVPKFLILKILSSF